MNKIHGEQLIKAYEDLRTFVEGDEFAPEQLLAVTKIFEAKKADPEASIMIYGVYNAGKSTLINALLGREVAVTDDIPTTDKVDAYQWGQYSILDTPGVDAPIAHELVTKEQMLKADVVIFVVDPVGTAEEVKTLSVLLDLIDERKQVFLVFNEKKAISEEEFIKLKDQTRQRLQHLAAQRGLSNVLKDIPIVKVNAKRALKGKLESQSKLLELSGYPSFERQLKDFLQSISSDEVYNRLKDQLVTFLGTYVSVLKDKTSSGLVKNYDKMLGEIVIEKSTLRQQVIQDISRAEQLVYTKSKNILRNSEPTKIQLQIEQLIETTGQDTLQALEAQLQAFTRSVQAEIEGLQLTFPQVSVESLSAIPIDFAKLEGEIVSGESFAQETDSTSVDWDKVKDTTAQMSSFVKPEHIVGSLQLIKKGFPALMKGIGQKTMEKWAGTIIGKAIPVIGPAITVIGALYGLFSGDPEEKKLKQELEVQQQEKERALQQLEDFAVEISGGFESSLRQIVLGELDRLFETLIAQVSALRQAFDETDRNNSQRLEQLLEIQRQAFAA